MSSYEASLDFTAQSHSVGALMGMYALLEAKQNIKVPLMPFVVFMAFSIEAYLNSIGDRVIPFWEDLERLPWKNKVNIIHHAAQKHPDWGKVPLQFAKEVFELRDKLAHGKPEKVSLSAPVSAYPSQIAFMNDLKPEWFKKINEEWLLDAKGKFRELMVYLGSLHGFHESDHLCSSSGNIKVTDQVSYGGR